MKECQLHPNTRMIKTNRWTKDCAEHQTDGCRTTSGERLVNNSAEETAAPVQLVQTFSSGQFQLLSCNNVFLFLSFLRLVEMRIKNCNYYYSCNVKKNSPIHLIFLSTFLLRVMRVKGTDRTSSLVVPLWFFLHAHIPIECVKWNELKCRLTPCVVLFIVLPCRSFAIISQICP